MNCARPRRHRLDHHRTEATTLKGPTMRRAGAVATLSLSVLMQFFATPTSIGCMALLIPGLTIAFVLPMIPEVMWIAGVAGYLILVCEAMVAVPLWMLAHPTFEGDGLHGRGFAGDQLRSTSSVAVIPNDIRISHEMQVKMK